MLLLIIYNYLICAPPITIDDPSAIVNVASPRLNVIELTEVVSPRSWLVNEIEASEPSLPAGP